MMGQMERSRIAEIDPSTHISTRELLMPPRGYLSVKGALLDCSMIVGLVVRPHCVTHRVCCSNAALITTLCGSVRYTSPSGGGSQPLLNWLRRYHPSHTSRTSVLSTPSPQRETRTRCWWRAQSRSRSWWSKSKPAERWHPRRPPGATWRLLTC